MNALSPLAPRLAKLIPRLATDHDGEVIATVRAIARTLQSAGLDWHTLAQSIGHDLQPEVVVVHRDRAAAEPTDPKSWREVARWCFDHDKGRLTPKEREFVRDMSHRLVCGGTPTEKQANWLRAIYAKLRSAAQ